MAEKKASDPSGLWLDNSIKIAKLFFGPLREIYYGARSRTLPWGECFLLSAASCVLLLFHVDRFTFARLHMEPLYPTWLPLYLLYSHVIILSPFWLWGLYQVAKRHRLSKDLGEAFLSVGLKNSIGRLPGYIFDRPVDEYTRRLRLTSAGIPKTAFESAKEGLQTALRIYVDEIAQRVDQGTTDIVYSHSPMPTVTAIDNIRELGRWKFVVGRTRGRVVVADLLKVPHLLIAGQTGGGKSTFLAQFVTSLYLNNSDSDFTLIDLKGGMELSLFAELKRVSLVADIGEAINLLSLFSTKLEQRMVLLRENHCKNLESYLAIPEAERKYVEGISEKHESRRHIIVIDEAAEMFLAGYHADSRAIMTARRILSQIARQGRSVGIHLVVATQRPDAKSLDPQVKANLPGVLCFQMVNDASSISVLGNGRATELTSNAGRAIWKCGSEMVEVQTPILSDRDINALLRRENS